MAFTAVAGQKTTGAGLASSTSHNRVYAATPTQNNLLTLQYNTDQTAPTITPPTGWTKVRESSNGAGTAGIYYKIAGAGESTTVTITQTPAGFADMCINEWSGGVTSSIVDQSGAVTSAAATHLNVPTDGATSQAVELALVSIVMGGAPGADATWTNSFSTDNYSSGGGVQGHALLSSAAVASTNPSWPNSVLSSGVIATFKALVASQLPILGMY